MQILTSSDWYVSGVNGAEYGTISIGFNTSNLGFGAATPDIELVVDTDTKLPIKAQVLENDPWEKKVK